MSPIVIVVGSKHVAPFTSSNNSSEASCRLNCSYSPCQALHTTASIERHINMSERPQPRPTASALSKHGRDLEQEEASKIQRQHYFHHPPQQFLHQYYATRNPTDWVPPPLETYDQGAGSVDQSMARPGSKQPVQQAPPRRAPVTQTSGPPKMQTTPSRPQDPHHQRQPGIPLASNPFRQRASSRITIAAKPAHDISISSAGAMEDIREEAFKEQHQWSQAALADLEPRHIVAIPGISPKHASFGVPRYATKRRLLPSEVWLLRGLDPSSRYLAYTRMKRMVGLMVRCDLRSPQSQQYWKQITEFGTKLLEIERNWCVQTFFRVDVQQQRVRWGGCSSRPICRYTG
jgi:hypothetical protein